MASNPFHEVQRLREIARPERAVKDMDGLLALTALLPTSATS